MEANVFKLQGYYPKGSYQVSICKDHMGDLQGRVYIPASGTTHDFSSVWQMVKQIEEDITNNSFPQKTVETRTWTKNSGAKTNNHKEQQEVRHHFEKVMGTFLVEIQYCRNATWQGIIHWLDKRQSKTFRSQFEMLKLMEEAITL